MKILNIDETYSDVEFEVEDTKWVAYFKIDVLIGSNYPYIAFNEDGSLFCYTMQPQEQSNGFKELDRDGSDRIYMGKVQYEGDFKESVVYYE